MRFIMGGIAAVVALVFASSAMAASHHPTGEYSDFGECPLNTPSVEECVFSVTTSGSVTIGSKTVPIKNPVTLQGGLATAEGGGTLFVAAENGVTLSKTPQPVPGGLVGVTAPTWWPKFLQEWFNNLISEGATGVNATLELAKPASAIQVSNENLVNQEGTVVGLPAKVHLENAILGNNCYIGSSSKPVQLELTDGTSGSLKGSVGTLAFNSEFTMVTVTGLKLVDGLFEAPETTGCGALLPILVNPFISSVVGTPSGSGKNSAILEGTLKDAVASSVKASE